MTFSWDDAYLFFLVLSTRFYLSFQLLALLEQHKLAQEGGIAALYVFSYSLLKKMQCVSYA